MSQPITHNVSLHLRIQMVGALEHLLKQLTLDTATGRYSSNNVALTPTQMAHLEQLLTAIR